MKSNIIIIDSQSRSFERALEETNKVAAYMGLSVQDAQGQRLMTLCPIIESLASAFHSMNISRGSYLSPA